MTKDIGPQCNVKAAAASPRMAFPSSFSFRIVYVGINLIVAAAQQLLPDRGVVVLPSKKGWVLGHGGTSQVRQSEPCGSTELKATGVRRKCQCLVCNPR